ncbi:hypothetical protein, partial [Azotobacter chroococcum]|uniref:hypothetical protein n=1 Tax=Azotobacter chroococcum TaxID=353 RepID=UPI001B8D7C6A
SCWVWKSRRRRAALSIGGGSRGFVRSRGTSGDPTSIINDNGFIGNKKRAANPAAAPGASGVKFFAKAA